MKSCVSPGVTGVLIITIIFLGTLNILQFRHSQLCRQLDLEFKEPNLQNPNEEKPKIRWTYSVGALQYLTGKELQLYQLMQDFEFDLQNKLNKVTSWLDDFKESSLKGTQHLTNQAQIIEEISSHPLMIFRMIRRFVNLKHDLLQYQPNQPIEEYLDNLESEFASQLPNLADYNSSIENIINLRYIYTLNISDLINGNISNIQTNVGLTDSQAYEIAFHAENINAFTEAISWLRTLIKRNITKSVYNGALFDAFEINSRILRGDLYRVSKKHDAMMDLINDDNFWTVEHRFTTKIFSNSSEKFITLKEAYSSETKYTFQSVCAGELSMSEKQRSELYCFYETKLHPTWYINPLKVEVYSWDPYVARIYEVVNETVIEYLRSISEPNLIPAHVINSDFNKSDPNSKSNRLDKARIAMHAFMEEKTKMLDYLALKIGYMTGLEVYNKNDFPKSSEAIQIASYALGGWYDCHFDAFRNGVFCDPLEGDRIATFMIYLSDVTLGGNTAFPLLGVSAQPIKKSAIFWYNFHKNGNNHNKTLHGGCPVLIGQKWISNTWIRSFANFQKRKCSLNPNE